MINLEKLEFFYELVTSGQWIVNSTAGTVYSTYANRNIGFIDRTGYVRITKKYLGIPGAYVFLHILIYRHAYGPFDPNMTINHINGDKTDNRLCNLELLTISDNIKHAYDTNLRHNPRNKISTETKELIYSRYLENPNITAIGREFNLPRKTVSGIINSRK